MKSSYSRIAIQKAAKSPLIRQLSRTTDFIAPRSLSTRTWINSGSFNRKVANLEKNVNKVANDTTASRSKLVSKEKNNNECFHSFSKEEIVFSNPITGDALNQMKKRKHQIVTETIEDANSASSGGLPGKGSTNDDFIYCYEQNSELQDTMAYSLSFTDAESVFPNAFIADLLDDRQKLQLKHATTTNEGKYQGKEDEFNPGQLSLLVHPHSVAIKDEGAVKAWDMNDDLEPDHQDLLSSVMNEIHHESPLPTTLQDTTHQNDPRAIVVTEANVPFRIVNVNEAWEGLCGFTASECRGKTLSCIQGPETNQCAVTALMSHLLRGDEAGTILTNYTKEGRKFQNRLRVGPLRDSHNRVTHFVGVLKEIVDKDENFQHSKQIHT